jgi:hypothetical protein
MKIALLFLTIANIYHEGYWKDFLHGYEKQYSIYVHAKETLSNDSFFKPYEMSVKVPTTWFRTMKAQVAMLKEALKDPENEKFIFLSESTIPLQDFDTVFATVTATEKSIFTYFPNEYKNARSLDRIPKEFRYGNSQWVVLNRKHAALMTADTTYLPIIVCYVADQEHYPSSFLASQGLLHTEVVKRNTTYVNWEKSNGLNPCTFSNFNDRYEFECITNAIKEGMLFARKIDAHANIGLLDPYLSYRKKDEMFHKLDQQINI